MRESTQKNSIFQKMVFSLALLPLFLLAVNFSHGFVTDSSYSRIEAEPLVIESNSEKINVPTDDSGGDFEKGTAEGSIASLVERIVTERTVVREIKPQYLVVQTNSPDLLERLSSLEKTVSSFESQRAVNFSGYGLHSASPPSYNTAGLSQRIDQLRNTSLFTPTITNPTITGGMLSGVTLSSATISATGLSQFATSTISKLTVSGETTLGVATGVFHDKGGRVCNVKAYGAVGDNATDNHAAIMSAIEDCEEGGTVYFPPGQYRIYQPIVLDTPVILQGAYAPRWSYSSSPRSSIRADFNNFSGGAIIHVRDRTISGQAEHNNGGRIINISIDGGSSVETNVHGLHFEGLVRDWRIENVDISQMTGNGFVAEVGAGSGNPRGFTIVHLSIYSADGHGFRATALNDSYLEDVLTVGNALRGFYLSSMGETKVNNSRAAFNALEGLYIDGASTNGGLQFTDFSTDRNDRHGVRISSTGTTTVSFNGLLTRRDGKNDGGGSETPYAGVAIIGSPSDKVAPVLISNLTQITGINDEGGGTPSPSVGVRVDQALYAMIDGVLWGVDQAYVDGGTNETFIIQEDSLLKTGYAGVIGEELYNRKWEVGVGSLNYSGNIGVSTTTPTSKLHIVGTTPETSVVTITGASGQTADYLRVKSTYSQDEGDVLTLSSGGYLGIGTSTLPRRLTIAGSDNVGARFVNTINNARFDLRVEETQAFIGTMSNNDLRFITNSTSKVAITAGGNMGINTVSPTYRLTVVGTAGFSGLSSAIASGDALCLSGATEMVVNTGAQTCTVSSERFKHAIAELSPEESADIARMLRPVSFVYNESDETRIGLIAEEVAEIDARLMFTEEDGTPRGVRYEDIVAVLIGAFKHQQQQITSLLSDGYRSASDAITAVFDRIVAKKVTTEILEAKKIEVEQDISVSGRVCIEDVCVNKTELRALLESVGRLPGGSSPQENTTVVDEGENISHKEESSLNDEEEALEETEEVEMVEESTLSEEEISGDTNEDPQEIHSSPEEEKVENTPTEEDEKEQTEKEISQISEGEVSDDKIDQ